MLKFILTMVFAFPTLGHASSEAVQLKTEVKKAKSELKTLNCEDWAKTLGNAYLQNADLNKELVGSAPIIKKVDTMYFTDEKTKKAYGNVLDHTASEALLERKDGSFQVLVIMGDKQTGKCDPKKAYTGVETAVKDPANDKNIKNEVIIHGDFASINEE